MSKKNVTEIIARSMPKRIVLRKEMLRRLDLSLLAEVRGGQQRGLPEAHQPNSVLTSNAGND